MKRSCKEPYKEILDWEEEFKKYKKLCRSSRGEFNNYLQWKSHIISKISKIENEDDKENFKHFCINKERSAKALPNISLNFIIAFIPIYISSIIKDFNVPILTAIFVIIVFMMAIFFTVFQIKDYENRHYFYKDILKIIESQEKTIHK